jgi:Ca-activated chloride channel family protein
VTTSKYTQPALNTLSEWLTLRLRYKTPKNEMNDQEKSQLLTYIVKGKPSSFNQASKHFKFASAVAAFGQLLTRSQYQKTLTLDEIYDLASQAKGEDPFGYRQEFLELIRRAQHRF